MSGRILRSCLALAAALAFLACGEDGDSETTTVGEPDAAPDASGGGVTGDTGTGGMSGGGAGGGDGPAMGACANGLDDDMDGLIDFPDDPGCASAGDPDEFGDPAPPAQCDDGEDNDVDGFTDFPEDPGCGSIFDDDEGDDAGPNLPQCGDGRDNDRDGLVDLEDPGCASLADPGEIDPDMPAQCADRLDNDEDGIIDFPREPGCAAAGDDDEVDPEMPPVCANGVDDDADGAIDYPVDPGCAGAGDRNEADPMVTPQCSDGDDNDGDGTIDYPEDRGCTSAADYTEGGRCGGGVDVTEFTPGMPWRGNTNGGRFGDEGSCGGAGSPEVVFLYRLERDIERLVVSTVEAETEVQTTLYVRARCSDTETELACNREALDDGVNANRVEVLAPERGEYFIFVDGAEGNGGFVELRIEEVPIAECRNLFDDDGDGRIDYPEDPGCDRLEDRDETSPEEAPACADGMDNDGDGVTDFPGDLGCFAAVDDDEVDVCGQGVRVREFPVDDGAVEGDLQVDGTLSFSGSCGGAAGNEHIWRYPNPFNARITFSVNHEGTERDTLVYVRKDSCTSSGAEQACDFGRPNQDGTPRRGQVRIDRAAPGDYYVFVDANANFGEGHPYRLTAEVERLEPGCVDGADNDGDGFIDGDDLGCADPEDEDERDPPEGAPVPACSDFEDNDGDGEIDYPFDPGCGFKGDLTEDNPEVAAACSNGIDDDEDGVTDFPDDAGCQARGDDEERNPLPAPECGDRIDNDMDGAIDYPNDPGCDAAGDPSEQDPDVDPVCADEIDNDRDGLVDHPFDPGCVAAAGRSEEDPDPLPVCKNGEDDDEDGIVDFPRDPGCLSAGDGDETDRQFAPQCANGRDDDGDMRVDFPDDPGCRFAADDREENEGPTLQRCRDGVDNDDDGAVDLADVGCFGARDDDEEDPEVVPLCANEVDDDGDGETDWPADDGCAAKGDECEQPGWAQCDGECLNIIEDEQNCGQCGRVCDDGVECIDGFCGGLFVFEGIMQDVPPAELGGWEVCHTSAYGSRGDSVAQILQACDGDYVMYGCKQNNAANWQLLAMGERDAVFMDTGDRNNNLNNHNGVSWYFSSGYSIGFVGLGDPVSRNSCDTNNVRPELRLCWHSSGGSLSGGYRCGARTGLNGAQDWTRQVWTSR